MGCDTGTQGTPRNTRVPGECGAHIGQDTTDNRCLQQEAVLYGPIGTQVSGRTPVPGNRVSGFPGPGQTRVQGLLGSREHLGF